MSNVIMEVSLMLVPCLVVLGHLCRSGTAGRLVARSLRRDNAGAGRTASVSQGSTTAVTWTTEDAFTGTTIAGDQMTADVAEDAMVHRYRERRTCVPQRITVSCGRCRTPQIVHPDPGTHRFSLVCLRCHHSTLITLLAAS